MIATKVMVMLFQIIAVFKLLFCLVTGKYMELILLLYIVVLIVISARYSLAIGYS